MKDYTKAIVVFKIGRREHMCRLLHEGLLYMNCVDYFRNSNNSDQGDEFEGAEIVDCGKVVSYRSTILQEKVFCLWHVNDRDSPCVDKCEQRNDGLWELSIDTKKFKGFTNGNLESSALVVIRNMKEFNQRLKKVLSERFPHRYWSNAVQYYDPNEAHFLPVNAFMKPSLYQKQNELRYLVLDDIYNLGKPLEIRIGDITDIAVMFPMSQIRIIAEEK